MAPQIVKVVDRVKLGEGPHWDHATQSLYFVDVFGQTINRYVPATKKHTFAKIEEGKVSIIIPIENQKDEYLVTIERQLAIITWDGISDNVSKIKKLAQVDDEDGYRDNIFNDGKVDASGRLWVGTYLPTLADDGKFWLDKGSLYSFGAKSEPKIHLVKEIGISNGLAWNADNTKFYYIDSMKYRIDQFDFDLKNAAISNRETIFTLAKHDIPGFPDGMTIDTDDNLWVAIFNGGRVIKIDPRKPETLLYTISLPAQMVTSVTFGGSNLDEIYVTSCSFTLEGGDLDDHDNGATFKVTGIGSRGIAGVKAKLL